MKRLIWVANFFGIIALVFLVLNLTGCSNIDVKKKGDTWDVSYDSLFRELKDLYVNVDDQGVTVRLGSASTSSELGELVAATGQIWLKGGPLLDMTGRPRAATQAEMAAQFRALETQ
jgi:hypothetical protein